MAHDIRLAEGVWRVSTFENDKRGDVIGYLSVTEDADRWTEWFALLNGNAAPFDRNVVLEPVSGVIPPYLAPSFEAWIEARSGSPDYPKHPQGGLATAPDPKIGAGLYKTYRMRFEAFAGAIVLREPTESGIGTMSVELDEGSWLVAKFSQGAEGSRYGYISSFKDMSGDRHEFVAFEKEAWQGEDVLIAESVVIRLLGKELSDETEFRDWVEGGASNNPPTLGNAGRLETGDYGVQHYKAL